MESVSTPAGTFTLIFLSFTSLPVPWHTLHLSLITSPVPLHLSHVPTLTNCPKGVCWAYLTSPLPLQLEHASLSVPSLAPVPEQAEQFSVFLICISLSTPKTASLNSMFRLYLRSEPLVGPLLLDWELPKPPPNISNISSNMSENPP